MFKLTTYLGRYVIVCPLNHHSSLKTAMNRWTYMNYQP